ncbi:hypothetical protein AQUCO_05100081v1 [Aquilegia coerulea]|nr:hypothetical protein AQUCO_05100081v1 [Aquilegia coerulea]PIA31300.1 hypothetical protein AQUCO_05100081v1 [Aquilegia coerulea]
MLSYSTKMGERNMVCTSQIVDMEVDQQGESHLHPEHCFLLGNNPHYPHSNGYPMLSASGNASSIDLHHFPANHDSNIYYGIGNQFTSLQHHTYATNMDLGASSNFHNPCMIPPSGSRVFSIPHVASDHLPSSSHHGIAGGGINEFGGNHHFMDSVRSSGKRKNAEAVPGHYHQVNGLASSSSSSLGMPPLNTGMPHCEEQLEPGVCVFESSTSIPPEHRVNGVVPVTATGGRFGRSVRSRSNTLGLQMESPMMTNPNHLVQGNYMGQAFQPASWGEQQFGSNGNEGSSSTWNYTPAIPYLNGGGVHGVSSEITSMGGQGYPESNRNSTIFLQSSMHHHHHYYHPSPPAMQPMHAPNNYHLQPLVPSLRHPTGNTLHQGTINHSLDDSEIGSRYPRPFPSHGLRIYRPHRSGVNQTGPANSNRPHLRFLSEDDVAILEFPGFYEVGNSVDRHRDMRLDIDDMSYEELLALGERIGNVITGLPEETILRHLKTRLYMSSGAEDVNHETETCIVCQVEYGHQEKVGTLDCGHEYHADCIRRWLLVKNVCPICKVPAIEDGQKTK